MVEHPGVMNAVYFMRLLHSVIISVSVSLVSLQCNIFHVQVVRVDHSLSRNKSANPHSSIQPTTMNTNMNNNHPNTATLLFVSCAAVNSCNLGYDIGVSTDAGRLIQVDLDLSDRQREIFVGSINFWASTNHDISMHAFIDSYSIALVFGALLAHYSTDIYGRRYTFVVAALLFLLGIFIMVISSTYEFLLFGRGFVGLGVGIGLAVCKVGVLVCPL